MRYFFVIFIFLIPLCIWDESENAKRNQRYAAAEATAIPIESVSGMTIFSDRFGDPSTALKDGELYNIIKRNGRLYVYKVSALNQGNN